MSQLEIKEVEIMPEKEYFCSACEWTGKGEALVECPICGEELTELTTDEVEKSTLSPTFERYQPDELVKVDDEEIEDLTDD